MTSAQKRKKYEIEHSKITDTPQDVIRIRKEAAGQC